MMERVLAIAYYIVNYQKQDAEAKEIFNSIFDKSDGDLSAKIEAYIEFVQNAH